MFFSDLCCGSIASSSTVQFVAAAGHGGGVRLPTGRAPSTALGKQRRATTLDQSSGRRRRSSWQSDLDDGEVAANDDGRQRQHSGCSGARQADSDLGECSDTDAADQIAANGSVTEHVNATSKRPGAGGGTRTSGLRSSRIVCNKFPLRQ